MSDVPIDGMPGRTPGRAVTDPMVLMVIWVVMICVAGPIGDFPLNDDFLFAMSARSVFEHFHFEVPSGSAPNVGPQAYWGALFCLVSGFSFTALRMSTLVLGLVGVLTFHRLFLKIWKRRSLALIAALLLMANPLFFELANTFMTDVTFATCVIVAIFLIHKGMDEDDGTALCLGLVVALLAVLIRHLAIVVFVGFLFAQVVRGGRGPRNLCIAILPLVAGVAIHLAFSRWLQWSDRKPLPWPMNDLTIFSVLTSLRPLIFQSFAVLQYLGLFTLPFAAFCLLEHVRADWRTTFFGKGRVIGSLTLTIILMIAYCIKNAALMPSGLNVLTYFGLGPLTLRDTYVLKSNLPPLTPGMRSFWFVMTAASIVGAALLLLMLFKAATRFYASYPVRAVAWSPVERRACACIVFIAVTAFAYLAVVFAIATKYPLFDRYLLPLIALTLLLVPVLGRGAAPARRTMWVLGRGTVASTIGGLVLFTVAVTHDYLDWNRQRWVALSLLTDRGIAASRIDGGYEFNGWKLYDRNYQPVASKSFWWVIDDEYVIASGPMAGYSVERSATVHRWFGGNDISVVTLHRR